MKWKQLAKWQNVVRGSALVTFLVGLGTFTTELIVAGLVALAAPIPEKK